MRHYAPPGGAARMMMMIAAAMPIYFLSNSKLDIELVVNTNYRGIPFNLGEGSRESELFISLLLLPISALPQRFLPLSFLCYKIVLNPANAVQKFLTSPSYYQFQPPTDSLFLFPSKKYRCLSLQSLKLIGQYRMLQFKRILESLYSVICVFRQCLWSVKGLHNIGRSALDERNCQYTVVQYSCDFHPNISGVPSRGALGQGVALGEPGQVLI